MKFRATILSILFIFAVVFSSAGGMMRSSEDCCKVSHCHTKDKKQKSENCANFCCISILAVNTPQVFISKNIEKQIFSSKIFFKNDDKINNHGLPFFHPPSKI